MNPSEIDEAFREALAERSRGRIGTPLQHDYLDRWTDATTVPTGTFWGASIEVVLPELVSCELHRYGLIEPGLTAFFIDRVQPGWTVFDVGAHLGYYSLLAAELGADVHAFEPSPTTLRSLRRNLPPEIHIEPKGAWSETTTLVLQDFGSEHSAVTTFVSSRDESLDEPEETHQVPVTSIDDYVSRTNAVPDLMKVDAEGAELQVLQGAADTIESLRPLVTVEVGDPEGQHESRRVIEFATELGYDPFDMTADGIRPHTLAKKYTYGNILLAPVGQAR